MRALRRVLLVFAGLAALVAGSFLALVFALDTEAGRRLVAGELQSRLAAALDADVRVGSIQRIGIGGLVVGEIRIEQEGQPLADVPRTTVELTRPGFLPPFVAFKIELHDPQITLREGEDGWEWMAPPAAPDPAESFDLATLGAELRWVLAWIDHVSLRVQRGRVAFVPRQGELPEVGGLRLRARLSGGAVRAPRLQMGDLAFALGRSRLDAHGSLEVGGRGRVRLAARLAPLDGSSLQRFVPQVAGGASGRLDLAVRGTLAEPAATLLWRSAQPGAAPWLDLRLARREDNPGGWHLAGTLDDFRPDRLLRDAPPSELSGNLSLSMDAAGGLLPQSAQIYLHRSTLAGVALDWLRLDAAGAGTQLRGRVEAATPADAAQVQADFDLDMEGGARLRTTVDGALTDAARLGLGELWSGTKLQFHLEGDARELLSEAPHGSLDLQLGSGSIRSLPVRRGAARLSLTPEALRLENLDLAVGRGRLQGEGVWPLSGSGPGTAAEVEGQLSGDVDLRLIPDSAGLLPLRADVHGAPGDVAVEMVLEAPQEVAVGMLNLGGRLEATVGGLGSPAPHGAANFRGPVAATGAWSRWRGTSAADATLEVDWKRRAAPAIRDRVGFSLDLDAVDEERHASLAGVFEGGAGTWELDLSRMRLAPEAGAPLALAHAAAFRLKRGLLEVEDLQLDVAGGTLQAAGRIVSEGDGASDLRVSGSGLAMVEICRLARIPTACSGALQLEAHVEQRSGEPSVQARADISGLMLAGADYGTLGTTLSGTPASGLRLAADLAGPHGEALDMHIDLPTLAGTTFRPDRTAALRGEVRAQGFRLEGLRLLTGRDVRRLAGAARSRITLGGTLDAPTFDGTLTVDDLVISLAAAGAVHRDGRLELAFDADRMRVKEFSLDDGAIRASGTAGFGSHEALDLSLTLQDATVIERPEATVVAGGSVSLRGTLSAPVLDGKLGILSARLRPTVTMGSSTARDPSILVVHAPRDGMPWEDGFPPPGLPRAVVDAAAPEDSFLDRLAVAVSVDVDGPVEIRRHDAHLRLGGGVSLAKAGMEPLRVRGRVSSQGGWYSFQGRRLDLVHANLEFRGRAPIDPALDVEATYRTPDYLITAEITGSATHPELNLSSVPRLSQSDVLSVLLFGEPTSDINSEQGDALQQQALGVLASYIAPELQRSVLDTFGWASLTFRMPTGSSAGSLGIGRYFGEDVFVSIAQDFGGPSGGTARQLDGLVGSSATVQYRLTSGLVLQGASSTEGESTVDLIWNHRY